MRTYRYVTVDVFTDERFGGNPLAVVPDARGLSDDEMQRLAAEFNYSETTFVLPPSDPAHAARVRIFNRAHEMPFAGHPNVGTAYVLASETVSPGELLVFEELAGLVEARLDRDAAGALRGASITAPQPLRMLAELPRASVAACLGVELADVDVTAHAPTVATVGVTFALVRVEASALRTAAPRLDAYRDLAQTTPELEGRLSIFAYAPEADGLVRARMFAPLAGTWEDPATGSASATLAAFLLHLGADERTELTIRQGVEMGRPSTLYASAWRSTEGIRAGVRGACVPVFSGEVRL